MTTTAVAPKLTRSARVWTEGIKAFETGIAREHNPYTSLKPGEVNDGQHTQDATQWYMGWDDANIIINNGRTQVSM